MQGDDGRVGCRAERTESQSGKWYCGRKSLQQQGRGGQSEVERSTLTREKATHREIKDGRGCQR